jgi:hypothetical protein
MLGIACQLGCILLSSSLATTQPGSTHTPTNHACGTNNQPVKSEKKRRRGGERKREREKEGEYVSFPIQAVSGQRLRWRESKKKMQVKVSLLSCPYFYAQT